MPRAVLWLLLCLCAGLLPAAAQQKLMPYQIKPDARMRNTPGVELYLLRARPVKLFNWQGEPVQGEVTLLNNTDAPQALTVRAHLLHGVDSIAGAQQQAVEVPAYSRASLTLTWPATQVKPYGQAMVIELLQGDKVIASAEDYFVVHHDVWAVSIAGNHPVAFTAEVSGPAALEGAVERFRASYITTFEKFFWAPDDFADMTPDKPVWFSGQVRYHESTENLKLLCAYGRKVGVMPTTYGKSIGSGSGARDVIRERPELVNGYGGVLAYAPDTEELARWDKDEKPYWQSIGWAHYNMNDPAVVQHGINEIRESTKTFGWAAVRFDGHFRARTGRQRVGDQMVEFTPAMADAQTAANQKALKDQMRQVDPHFAYGYNYGECDFTARLIDNPRESIELCEGGGHIMDEYAKQNAGASHPFRKWSDYAHAMVKSVEQVRRLGGHYYPMVHSAGPVARYQNIFVFAAGGHPNGTPGADHPYNAFATRYAELLWGPEVRNLWNPCGIVIVNPGVLWEDYVREERLDATRTRLIIHLINPPAHETATESEAAQAELGRRDRRKWEIKAAADKAKVQPDYSELDKLPPVQLYPVPKTDVAVKLVPKALPGGPWTIRRALLLDPETTAATPLAVDASDPYFAQVRVPELKFWAVLVVDLDRKEN